MEYLLFRLYGALASWGEIAVGESRHSALYPGKSALLGLLAAALGVPRDEEEQQAALARSYRFAVKVISAGHLLLDYQTVQVPDSAGKLIYRTRRDELVVGRERCGTILSCREYRCDAVSLVSVAANEESPYSLHELRAALLKPKFHLYLGRKSCPLAAPLNPMVRSGHNFREALDKYPAGALYLPNYPMRRAEREAGKGLDLTDSLVQMSQSGAELSGLAYGRGSIRYYWEGDICEIAPLENTSPQEVIRHDQPLSRARWQFTQRTEYLLKQKEGT